MRKLVALWIRLHRLGAGIGRRLAQKRELSQLDERALKDIGVAPWSSQLGEQVAKYRSESRLWLAARVGMY